jgi:DNA-binding transcriptional ArsR family regulator
LKRAIRAYRALDLARTPYKRSTRPPKRAKRLNDTELARLGARYGSGVTVYELAIEFGVHRTTISQHLKAAGVQMRLQPLSEQEVGTAATLYATGLSLANVGQQLGVNASTVYQALKQHGVEMRKPWDHPLQRGLEEQL